MKQTFYPLHKQNIARIWQQENTILQDLRSVPGCQICMCKRSISLRQIVRESTPGYTIDSLILLKARCSAFQCKL